MSQSHHHYLHQAPAQEHNHPLTETSPLRRTLASPSCYPSPQHYNHQHSQLQQHPQQQQQLEQLPHHSQQQQQLSHHSQQQQQLSHRPEQQQQLSHHSQQLQQHPHLQHVPGNNNNHHSFTTPATVHHHHANNPHHPPQVHFPPPPTSYPPCSSGGGAAAAMTSTSPMLDSGSGGSGSVDRVLLPDSSGGEHHVAGPSNIDYSYAYYEPGPPTRHGNVPSCQQQDHRARRGQYPSGGCDAAYREGSYRSKHTYLTRYGTEENIYEEISDVARARLLHPAARHQPSLLSLNQSLVDEEVRRVQFGHKRVLDQLNLSVEAMLMPSNSRSSSDDTDRDNEQQDQVTDLHSVGPTDDLLSPVGMAPPNHHHYHHHHHHQDMDSGFSGSSSGASYRSVCGSLRRGISLQRPKSGVVMPTTSTSTSLSQSSVAVGFGQSSPSSERVGAVVSFDTSDQRSSPNSKSFWSKKAWRKLGFSNTSLNKQQQKDEHRTRRNPLREEPTITSTPSPNTASRRSSTSILHTPKTRLATSSSSQRSSEDSWCSGSEQDITTDEDESDRSVTSSNRSNSHKLRNPFHKAKTLWRSGESPTATNTTNLQMRHSLDNSGIPLEVETAAHTAASGGCTPLGVNAAQSRLSRWFSIRRGSSHQYDVDSAASGGMMGPEGGGLQTSSPVKMLTGASGPGGGKMPELPEVDEDAFPNCTIQQRRHLPPSLPPSPGDLTQQQLKRRMIIAAIVHSENSYVATLQRLVNDYKKPLEESSPPILSNAKISTLFYRLPEILQCHTLFRIALAESVRSWDSDERIGDVFVASFSKAIVLDIYSGFINNFSVAMDMAKMEAKRKSALSDFLKVKQISSHDRLSFFGLMVKPVQRFPQFILFLQDLLKYTPQGHHDRMSLQLALTQLESLAEMLNERKREAEQFQAFKEMLRHITGKFAARPLSDSNRYLLREDNVTQFELNQYGLITKTKSRRLLLLNDLVVCVAVTPKQSDEFASSKRLTLKWMCPVTDIEVQDTSASPTLSRLLIHSNGNKSGSLKSNVSFDGNSQPQSDNLCTEMSNLMYDYEVISRIQDFVGTLKGSYEHITVDNTRQTLLQIQSSIQQKDAEMLWVDSCCLQLVVTRGGGGVNSNVVGSRTAVKEEVYTFQTDNPDVKKEWMTELRLAQLALDPSNSPAWEIPEQELRPSTKMPLFVKAQPVFNSQHPTDVSCGCYYSLPTTNKSSKYNRRPQSYLWICTTDGVSSHITILAQHPQHAGTLKTHFSFSLLETQVTCVEFIKTSTQATSSLAANTIWCGTYNRKLLIYTADFLEAEELLSVCSLPDTILHIKYLCDAVFVALANGSLLIFRRSCGDDGGWSLSGYDSLQLGTEAVSCLLPINSNLYASCGKKVFVISAPRGEITRSFVVQHEHLGNVNLMAHSGIGLWISLKNSSTICLYHTETFKHLQDINVASNVMRVTNTGGSGSGNDSINNNRSHVNVTALLACKGLLWVGTNVGISLTIPLPRLEGVPIISGRVNISYHAHFGPISFLLALQLTYPSPPQEIAVEEQSKPESTAESSAKLLHHLTKSPLVIRRRKSKERNLSRLSKTLPRGLGNGNASFSTSTTSSVFSDTCDVYGLYGKLMYIKDYEHNDSSLLTDPVYESLRRSDPELSTLSGKVSTLDRRLKMKVSRPRSLDLSNWSVDSRTSSVYTSSGGGSDDSIAQRLSCKTNSDNASSVVKPSETESTVKLTVKEETTRVHTGDVKKKVNDTHTVDNNPRRTIITLMGGRGYVNWRQPGCSTEKNKSVAPPREPNSTDAHIVIWELKL